MENKHFEIDGYKAHVMWVGDSHYCGYVEVPTTHPCYKVDYLDNDYNNLVSNIDVHGGVTFTSHAVNGVGEDSWFIGFDAAHIGDKTKYDDLGTFRDIEYMSNECVRLVDQLKEIENSNVLTLGTIIKRVKQIEDCSCDYEAAHAMEDELYFDFVEYVSVHGNDNLREMADAVLKTKDLNFPRYTA